MKSGLDSIDLRLLRCFDALMAERNVSRAAQRVNLSQPAMSVALGRLRALFGDPLFLRGHGEMVPTSRALTLAEPVRGVLEGLGRLASTSAPFDPATVRMQFTLTAPGYIAYVILPRLMRYLEKNAPGVSVEARAANRERATEWLENGEVDFRIGWIREPPRELRFKTLYGDGFVCLARREHPGIPRRLTAELFCSLPHVRPMVHRQSDSGRVIDQAVELLGRRLNIALLVQEVLTVPYVVASSNLIAAVPARLARGFTGQLPIRSHPLPLRLPEQSIALYWHERTHRDPAHEWFRDVIGRIAKTL
jgi:DNA-binding transcriptional LysR family regulator